MLSKIQQMIVQLLKTIGVSNIMTSEVEAALGLKVKNRNGATFQVFEGTVQKLAAI